MINGVKALSILTCGCSGQSFSEQRAHIKKTDVEAYTDEIMRYCLIGDEKFGGSFLIGFAAGVDALCSGSVDWDDPVGDALSALADVLKGSHGKERKTDVLSGFDAREERRMAEDCQLKKSGEVLA